jgi:dTDP-4-amino-4,6-dideoxygalactose transaminase
MFLWWVYQCLNIIILMNLLIAMMNASMQVIQLDKITQWKFARTEIWLKFLEKKKGLPVPLNLVEVHPSINLK